MKKISHVIVILFALTACATKNDKVLNAKMAEQTEISSRADLRAEAKSAVNENDNLSPEQKEKLNALRVQVSSQMDEINKKSLELRAVLLKDLLAPNYNGKEVVLIKNRMRKLEDKRLSMIFESAEKANLILGRQAALNPQLMQQFLSGPEARD
jgi:hypothetical protein